jgi:hypothetical protein
VSRWVVLLLLATSFGCSGLDEADAGIVGLEVSYERPDTIEVGETLQLSARPLDKQGDSVPAAVAWVALDPTVSLDATTGLMTGVAPGTARVQATVGSLGSPLLTFAVIPPADTLVIAGDSIFTVAIDAPSPPLVTRLESLHPPGVLAGRSVIYTITLPDPLAGAPAATLSTGAVADTFATAADGTVAAVTVVPVPGATPPDSVVVEVRASRTRGAAVPGSGQRFIVRFQP